MLNRSDSTDPRRQQLSSLMDGELRGDEAADACMLWRQDGQARADWHAWHLIGDVLRSDELAVRPARDEAFLQALRQRLEREPVPLAPQPLAAATPAVVQIANGVLSTEPAAAAPLRRARTRRWLMAPAAMAAGFLAVVGVTVVTRQSPSAGDAAALAQASPPAAAASVVLVRNPQLDRYLSAHRALANGGMAGAGAEQRMHIVYEGR